LHPEENDLLSMDKIHGYLETELAQRMAQAAARGQLYTEKPFVMSKLPEAGGEDAILIQGIIDVFFVEEKHIVLLDYKTDVVQQAEELRQRYEVQLQLYKEAIERSMNLPVKEMLIYSFCLEKTVAL
jgi:ATP-dependent helicase/nuclease subunit A